MSLTNTPAYYATATITSLESFIRQAAGSLKLDYFITMKLFKIALPTIGSLS